MTNVTARHGYNAVHLGGREYTNGRWTPACRIQHDNSGGRTPSTLHPTKEAVTCKRCLKVIEQDKHAAAVEARRQQSKAPLTKPIKKVRADNTAAPVERSGMDSLRSMLKLS